jgi:probable biosynthetic protein (TIGR04098 family)
MIGPRGLATQTFRLVLGLPHTNRDGLAEHLLLMHAGHLYWSAIARATGRKLSALRSASGEEIYATFYFIEEDFPADTPVSTFRLDDQLRFVVGLRAFKGLALEGRIVFNQARRLAGPAPPLVAGRHPFVRLASIFTERASGNRRLRVAAPVDADFSALPPLPDRENTFHLTRGAEASGDLGLIGGAWTPLAGHPPEMRYTVDPDRDTNGAGLLYFANYAVFINIAEREALSGMAASALVANHVGRDVRRRRLAYYGNAEPNEVLRIAAEVFGRSDENGTVAIRCRVRRETDDHLICLSEAIVHLRPAP